MIVLGILEFEAKPHAARITSVVYDDSGRFIVTGSADTSIKVDFQHEYKKLSKTNLYNQIAW